LARGTKPGLSPRRTISGRQRPIPATASAVVPPLVGAVGEDHLDGREQPARGAQERHGPVPALDVGGMDGGAPQQAERVGQDVPLLALGLLARVVARRVDAGAPCSALPTLRLSMIAAVGRASLPLCSRAWTNRAWCRHRGAPSQAQRVR